jgi:hypothetical protein
MGIIDELNRIIIREEDEDFEEKRPSKRISSDIDMDDADEGVKKSKPSAEEITSHLEAIKDAARYVDSLVDDEPDNFTAFEVERSLRDAIRKMEKLLKEVYKEKSKETISSDEE